MNPYKPGQTFASDVAYAVNHSLDLPRLRSVVGEHVAAAVRDERIVRSEHILIGGSGDSLFAALSVAPAFRRWTGIATEAKTAMELARYETALLTPRDLVISVSNSGSSSRARETVLLAKDRGATTLGVTGGWSGTAPIFYTFTWKRCQGSSCTNFQTIAVGPEYTISNDEASMNYRYEVQVCAINLVSQRQVFPVELVLERPDLSFSLFLLTQIEGEGHAVGTFQVKQRTSREDGNPSPILPDKLLLVRLHCPSRFQLRRRTLVLLAPFGRC